MLSWLKKKQQPNTNAKQLLEQAIQFEDKGETAKAIEHYLKVITINAHWDTPHYNLGLIYKYRNEWMLSYQHNKKATELDATNEAAWWNLGIAATYLKKWRIARQAWNNCGVSIEINDNEPELNLGTCPIRLNPNANGEVVWCSRIDPARAVIQNIPLPESNYGYADTILNDGAPVGTRISNGVEYPVLNALQAVKRSDYSTYSIIAFTNQQETIDKLSAFCDDANVEMEDWSTVKYLCKKCSEGTPHEHHDEDLQTTENNQRYIGFADINKENIVRVLSIWHTITLCEYSEILLELE